MYPTKSDNFQDDDALMAALRAELRPEPLPESLVARIREDWDQRGQLTISRRYLPLHVLGIAAAACLVITLILPSPTGKLPLESKPSIALSSDEAAAIVSAMSVIAWDDYDEYSLELVGTSISAIKSSLQGETNSDTLPWSSDEDWDLPSSNDGGASRDPLQRGEMSTVLAPTAVPHEDEV